MDSSGRWQQVLIGDNIGRRTLKFSLSLKDFIDGSAIGIRHNIENIEAFSGEFHAQRNLDTNHAAGLGRYTLMRLVRAAIKSYGTDTTEQMLEIRNQLGDPAYVSLQPVVCNIRTCVPEGLDLQIRDVGDSRGIKTGAYEVLIGQKQLMWVVDGQHRKAGFEKVWDFLKRVTQTYKYPMKSTLFVPSNYTNELIDHTTHAFWSRIMEIALTKAAISVECHLGLKEDEEQQLFYDLNSKGKKVNQSLAFQYDHTDAINKYISDDLLLSDILAFKPSEKDVSDWHNDNGAISRKDINTVTCLLCLGKTNSKSATPSIVDKRREFLNRFWQIISKVHGFGSAKAKSSTVLAQPVVLKALAKLGFDLAFGHQHIRDEEGYKTLCAAIIDGSLDFSHTNNIWQALFLSNEGRESQHPGLSKFVYIPPDTNLDAGTYDAQNDWVRFGSRHNDIYPRLGDIVRYKIGLKPRPSVAKQLAITVSND